MNDSVYDLIIIGASAAGMSGAVYAARRRLNFKVISDDIGGEMALSGEIENWPATVHTTGIELTEKFKEQMKANDIAITEGVRVQNITKTDKGFTVTVTRNGAEVAEDVSHPKEGGSDSDSEQLQAKTVIVATGVHPRELGVPGEQEFRQKGVSYCTVCDGPLFSGKTVATIGGGNSALESAIMLSGIADKVYVVNKNAQFKGDDVMIDKVTNTLTGKNVEVIYNAMTTKINGEAMVTGLEYDDENGEAHSLDVDGIFVHIGMVPNSKFVPEEVERNEYGNIKVDMIGKTSMEGLFAAGDVTNLPYNQLAIAAGQGVSATLTAVDYLNKMK